jgi:hypothetical protein
VERLIEEQIRQLPQESNKITTIPIYSSLPSEQQMNAFKPAPSGFRKVSLINFVSIRNLFGMALCHYHHNILLFMHVFL